MAAPYIVSALFVIAVLGLCFWRPNAGRIFLGFFYLAMALGINAAFILASPASYADYAGMSYWPLYSNLATWTINTLTPRVFGLLLLGYEVALAVLLLGKGRSVKLGLWGVIIFILGIAPVSTLQLPWLGFAVAAAYLLTGYYPRSLWDVLAHHKPARTVAG